ncbi:MAG: penicillin-binding protein activator [Acidiferrobacterales bacterium]|nr:penicillin-binding protein activator [Acidiferrobacterales bacterium]
MNFILTVSARTFLSASIGGLCLLLSGCVEESTTAPASSASPTDTATVIADSPSTASSADELPALIDFPSQDAVAEVIEPEIEYSAWELINQAQTSGPDRNMKLIEAAHILLTQNNASQADSIINLLDRNALGESEQVEFEIFQARTRQFNDRHRSAFRQLNRISKRSDLQPEQALRIARLRVHSASYLGDQILLFQELVRLYGMLSSEDERLQIGHQIWQLLSMVSFDDLITALNDSDLTNVRLWTLLAYDINLARYDPHLMRNALDYWIAGHPDHQANQLIESGIYSDNLSYSNIGVLLPLSSQSRRAVQAFMDGFNAQHSADTSPDKPILTFIDIGSDPRHINQHHFQALFNGADFVVGPLGTSYVEEVTRIGNFIVPTLLLGVVDETSLPQEVYQFALAPEHDGVIAAQRARQDGHTTALILESPSNWSKRATEAFRTEWGRLGGVVIQSKVFEQGLDDYSDTIREVFNIDESVQRYRDLRNELGRGMKFIPRRRQDVDCIFLSSDHLHGQLIKPHIDFLKAHDVPVYATSRIFSGEVDKIADQDLDGIRFADMNWLVDQGDTARTLRKKLSSEHALSAGLNRIYAMGVDTYNLIPRLDTLRRNPNARHHGITSTMAVDEKGRVLREPMWVQFADGTPEPIIHLPDPETQVRPVIREPDDALVQPER